MSAPGQQALDLGQAGRRLLRATPSRLAAFADCPRRYRFTYLDRPAPPRGPAWAHNSVGAAVHVALARWWSEPLRRRTPLAAASLLMAAWQQDGFRDDEQSARFQELASGWVESYVARLDPADEPPGVERTVAARTTGMALSGRVDRLDDRDGELVVVDYKTGRAPPTDDDARTSPALALYAVAVGTTLRRACHRVELHHLRSGTVACHVHTDQSLERQLARAEALATDVVAAQDTLAAGGDADLVFPPVPTGRCGWCDYRGSCSEGQLASVARAPWAGLGDGG